MRASPDAVLKLSLAVAAVLAGSGIGYYYGVFPARSGARGRPARRCRRHRTSGRAPTGRPRSGQR
ncbi:hypothetical protein ACFSTD_18105 [Novosphingobium colocasiae]